MLCNACGRENAAGARFCDACGEPLRARSAETATRKTVTVVFTDVTGSTELGERLDPETLRDVMSRYFAVAQTTLERHGGTVEKFIGDAVMAVFGVPAVHEDDAVRAVRAVAELRDALDHLNGELEQEHGIRIVTRTGVNTGRVIVGGAESAADQRLATGDAVNVAARLEQAAAPGDVLIGAHTYDVARDVAVVEAVEPIVVKGKSEPLTAWRLVALRPDVPAFARPIRTPFVGRRKELADLTAGFEAAVRDNGCRLATIVGPPGIGKSRLARELVGSLEASARILVGRCVAYGEGISYLPLGEVVRAVAADDPRAELARLLAGVERGDVAARLIAGAVGVHGDAGSPEETAWAFRRLFETLASSRPLVVVVDDIHWAEPTLLDLLEYVAGSSNGASILIVCLARPDLFDVRPSWAAPQRRAQLVTLEPLDSDESESLVEGLLDERELPPGIARRIVESAEGNPLFAEQMLAMLADDPEGGEVVPPTIEALLAARIERLESLERAVLQRAAVEGRLFHRGSVARLLDGSDAGDAGGLGSTLLALVRKEFVRPDHSSFAGDDGFRFNHVLIRDVAYASMPKELRADLHGRLASWLEERADDLTGGDELVGYHLEQSYGYRVELGRVDAEARELAVRAGGLLARAGRRALDRFEPETAVLLLERARRLLEVDPRERARLLADLGRALRDSGTIETAADVLAEAVVEARRYGDEPAGLHAEIELATTAFMRGQSSPDALREVAQRAIAVFEALGDDALLADAWQLVALTELSAGDRGAQLEALRKARAYAMASGDTRRQIEAWNELGGSMLFGRTPVTEVIAFLDEELAWGRERGLGAIEADALLGGPYLDSRLGRFDLAREKLERSKALCREVGIPYGLAEAHFAGAQMELLAGDARAAEGELREAIRVATEMGAEHYTALYRTRIAHTLIAQDLDGEALAELELARGSSASSPFWKSARARILARQGDVREAVELAREAAESIESSDDITARAEILVWFAEVLRAAGDLGGASDALTEAVALHEEKGNVLNARHCSELLAVVSAGGARHDRATHGAGDRRPGG